MSRQHHDDQNLHFEFDSSWIFPAIMTFVFPPVGVFLLIKKYSETRSKANRTHNYKPLFSGGILLTIIGIFASGFTGAIMALTGGVVALTGFFNHRRQQREGTRLETTYLSIIGDRTSVSIKELAKVTGRSRRTVMRDLQTMLDDNILPSTAYIDHSARNLVMRRQEEEPIVAEVVEPVRPAQQAAAKPGQPAEEDPAAREARILRETFDAKLREIRYWNEEIADERVSARIDDIEATTANIFYLVREKPERANEIRTFMNYYLPTTLKLLKAYALLEKQNSSGKNIQTSRQEIEAILDKLAEGFRQQLDKLFRTDAIDISSDIEVLETMMARDGLTGSAR